MRRITLSLTLATALVMMTGTATAVAAAPAAGGGSNETGSPARVDANVRNDVAHFGISSSSRKQWNRDLRNDMAHFGETSTANTSSVPRLSSTPIVTRVDGGFDWFSVAVGAAGGLALVLVATAGSLALRRRRIDTAQA